MEIEIATVGLTLEESTAVVQTLTQQKRQELRDDVIEAAKIWRRRST